MNERAGGLKGHAAPWSKRTSWPVTAAAGVLLVLLGIYVFADKRGAANAILQITALALLISSLLSAWSELRGGDGLLAKFAMFRAGIGVTVGVIGVMHWFSGYIGEQAPRVVLGWGLVIYSLVYVVAFFAARQQVTGGVSDLALSAVALLLGLILIVNDDASSSTVLNLIGIVLLVGGALFLGLAYLRRQRTHHAAA